MDDNKIKNNIRKKTILLILLIFALIGTVGYGVYSYHWTDSDITAESYSLQLDNFDVSLYYGMYYLGNDYSNHDSSSGGGECQKNSDGSFDCEWSTDIKNNGSKDVSVVLSDFDVTATLDGSEVDVEVVNLRTNWENNTTTLSVNDYEHWRDARKSIEIYATIIPPGAGEEPVDVTDYIEEQEFYAMVSFKTTATEIH